MIGAFSGKGKTELRRSRYGAASVIFLGFRLLADHFGIRLRRFSEVRPVVDLQGIQERLVFVQAFLEVRKVPAFRRRPASSAMANMREKTIYCHLASVVMYSLQQLA